MKVLHVTSDCEVTPRPLLALEHTATPEYWLSIVCHSFNVYYTPAGCEGNY
jgi:hypothetical protein